MITHILFILFTYSYLGNEWMSLAGRTRTWRRLLFVINNIFIWLFGFTLPILLAGSSPILANSPVALYFIIIMIVYLLSKLSINITDWKEHVLKERYKTYDILKISTDTGKLYCVLLSSWICCHRDKNVAWLYATSQGRTANTLLCSDTLITLHRAERIHVHGRTWLVWSRLQVVDE